MNENAISGKWTEIKGEVQKMWGKLTDDELTKTKGDMKAIGGLIQQKYADQHSTYGTKLSDIFNRFTTAKDEKIQDVKNNLKN